MPRIAFQGSLGAYSHLACRAVAPDWEAVPCQTFDKVFDVVESGGADRAMLPVENSQAGRVSDLHRLLPQRSLFALAEHYQPVHHMLLGLPGARLDQVRTARSHPQALAQCRHWLKRHDIEPEVGTDTAGSALEVLRRGDPTVAAIASSLAGELYGLDVLAAEIEDDPSNTTRFLVMGRELVVPPATDQAFVTSLLFEIPHVPAALYKALGGFATHGVNLLKIESYQAGGAFVWTQFAVDIDGHPDHPAVAAALEELRFFSTQTRVLGVLRAAPHRRTTP
jgi:prephenate dehydratase